MSSIKNLNAKPYFHSPSFLYVLCTFIYLNIAPLIHILAFKITYLFEYIFPFELKSKKKRKEFCMSWLRMMKMRWSNIHLISDCMCRRQHDKRWNDWSFNIIQFKLQTLRWSTIEYSLKYSIRSNGYIIKLSDYLSSHKP